MSHILLVEDEQVLRRELKRVLERAGHVVQEAGDVPSALSYGLNRFELVLSDIRLPGLSGDTLVGQPDAPPLVLMTAFGSVRSAVDAIKQGAVDYLSKPFEPDELLQVVERTLEERRQRKAHSGGASRVSEVSEARLDGQDSGPALLGESPGFVEVIHRLRKVAPTAATVLVLGESGTGKELVARAIHQHSPRAAAPFVPVNCASIPEGLIESELFGHEKGSFTGALRDAPGLVRAAHQGTLFLDEIGELPLAAQARLLRVLQNNEVRKVGSHRAVQLDVRVVAATHRDLSTMVKEGTFRQDLYYRLRVFELHLPALRERGRDVILLAQHMLNRAAQRLNRPVPQLSKGAIAALLRAPFPGNVRELENSIERALILHEGGSIEAHLLGLGEDPQPTPMEDLTADPSLDGYFRRYVLAHEGHLNETELAERLGLSRKGLWEKRQRLGVPRRAKQAGERK